MHCETRKKLGPLVARLDRMSIQEGKEELRGRCALQVLGIAYEYTKTKKYVTMHVSDALKEMEE